MDTHSWLTAARDLIDSPHRHRINILAADRYGNPVSPLGPAAGYCLVGALQHVTGRIDWQNADGMPGAGEGGLAATLICTAAVLHPRFAGAPDILGAVNNSLGHAAVMDLLGTCIELTAPAAEPVTAAVVLLVGEEGLEPSRPSRDTRT